MISLWSNARFEDENNSAKLVVIQSPSLFPFHAEFRAKLMLDALRRTKFAAWMSHST